MTTATDQVETTEAVTVDLSVVSPGSRATASLPGVPDVPQALLTSKVPFARMMVGSFSTYVGVARDAQAVIQRWNEGTAAIDEELQKSDNPIVLHFRHALEDAAEELKASEAQYQADIAPFLAARKARDGAINAHVAEYKAPAVAELGGQIGVTEEEYLDARQMYKAASDTVKANVVSLKRQGIDLGAYAFPKLPGTKGSSSGSTEFTPRFATATIDNVPVTPNARGKVTPVQVAAALNITRDQVIKLLLVQALGNDRAIFDAASPHSEFRFNANGHHVTVTKGERANAKAVTNGDVNAAIDDDDEDEDEDES